LTKDLNIISKLQKELNFQPNSIKKLQFFVKSLLIFNNRYNLISKSTIPSIWHRHVLDSAQIIPFFNFKNKKIVIDLGSGGGFPGIIISIFNKNPDFHVKLFEKSRVKSFFLEQMIKKLDLNAKTYGNLENYDKIDGDYVVARAFKSLEKIIHFSREKIIKPHKLVIFQGKNAQEKIKNISNKIDFKYKLIKSITENDSKIFIGDVK
tara:strand:+ start:20 stop:640 length:621 start_codon:yes stop_codon:yes gene_type:complete